MQVDVNGTEIFFDIEGAQVDFSGDHHRSRPTVVVLHGGPGFDQGYLRPGLAPLSKNARLVFLDLRGQGRSGRPPVESCTLEQMADDVAALCALVGIHHPILFGHSAGGFVALQVALRHRALVSGLILCDSAPTLAPLPDPTPPPGLAVRAGSEAASIAQRMFSGDFSPSTMQAFGDLVVPFYAGPDHAEVPGRLMALSSVNPAVMLHFFGTLAARYDLRSRLSEISVATVVIVGGYDWVCPPAASRCIAEGIPDATLVEIPDAGHFPFSEEPDRFQAAVRAYLQQFVAPAVGNAGGS